MTEKIIQCALLNEAGVFMGMVHVPEEPTSLHLLEITECDLEPGRYRWDGKQFLPLPKPTAEKAVKEPNTLKAIALGFKAISDAGISLPKETMDWLAWYSTTMDFKG